MNFSNTSSPVSNRIIQSYITNYSCEAYFPLVFWKQMRSASNSSLGEMLSYIFGNRTPKRFVNMFSLYFVLNSSSLLCGQK